MLEKRWLAERSYRTQEGINLYREENIGEQSVENTLYMTRLYCVSVIPTKNSYSTFKLSVGDSVV